MLNILNQAFLEHNGSFDLQFTFFSSLDILFWLNFFIFLFQGYQLILVLDHLCMYSISIHSNFSNLFTLFSGPNSVMWVSVWLVAFLVGSKLFLHSIMRLFLSSICFLAIKSYHPIFEPSIIKFMLLSCFLCEAIESNFLWHGEGRGAFVSCLLFSLYLSLIMCCHVFASISFHLDLVALSRPSLCCCNMMARDRSSLTISLLFEISLFFPLS